jgi:hypothetical protein
MSGLPLQPRPSTGDKLAVAPPPSPGQQVQNMRGGILVFFPTYGVMESVAKRWQESGLWGAMEEAGGHIVMETRSGITPTAPPKSSTQAWKDQKRFKQREDDDEQSSSRHAGGTSQMSTIESFESALQRTGRCLLLAVCRLFPISHLLPPRQ